jgi:hypothetical protein
VADLTSVAAAYTSRGADASASHASLTDHHKTAAENHSRSNRRQHRSGIRDDVNRAAGSVQLLEQRTDERGVKRYAVLGKCGRAFRLAQNATDHLIVTTR